MKVVYLLQFSHVEISLVSLVIRTDGMLNLLNYVWLNVSFILEVVYMDNHNCKNIAILGSTGSIGTQTLDVIKNLRNIKVAAITAHSNIDLFEKQIREFNPELAVITDFNAAKELKKRISDTKTKILEGTDALIEAACYPSVDTVVNALVGNIGLLPTIEAIRKKKNIALANKETLVSAGELVMKEVSAAGVNLYPIDSEHSAILQCLRGNCHNKLEKIILTASGGPFKEREDLSNVTVSEALAHPNWDMGAKITVDSATLMNKGLEVIEAKWLFDINLSQIEVIVHPQSIIHSMVEFEDGAVIAQLGEPDMRLPIQYALTYPKRVRNNFPKLNLFENNLLTFDKPNIDKFPCLRLAFDAIKAGGTLPAVLNAANEVLVQKFIAEEIKFTDIPILIEKAMSAYNIKYSYTLTDVMEADAWAREFVK